MVLAADANKSDGGDDIDTSAVLLHGVGAVGSCIFLIIAVEPLFPAEEASTQPHRLCFHLQPTHGENSVEHN